VEAATARVSPASAKARPKSSWSVSGSVRLARRPPFVALALEDVDDAAVVGGPSGGHGEGVAGERDDAGEVAVGGLGVGVADPGDELPPIAVELVDVDEAGVEAVDVGTRGADRQASAVEGDGGAEEVVGVALLIGGREVGPRSRGGEDGEGEDEGRAHGASIADRRRPRKVGARGRPGPAQSGVWPDVG
jgi:hypothetical protein